MKIQISALFCENITKNYSRPYRIFTQAFLLLEASDCHRLN